MAQLFLAHVDLVVRDMTASIEYYCRKLGFSLIEDARVEGELPLYLSKGSARSMRLVLLRSSRVGATLELLELGEGGAPPAPGDRSKEFRSNVSFVVDDLTSFVANLREYGVLPRSPTFRVNLPRAGVSEIVLYDDPDGHVLEFIQKPSQAQPA